jgi:hypothetical protein
MKLKKLITNLEKLIPSNNRTITVRHDAGFFSCCSKMFKSIIMHYNEFGFFPNVNTAHLWNLYKDSGDKDILNYFFKKYDYKKEEKVLNKNTKLYLTSEKDEDQFSDYAKLNYVHINEVVPRYFTLSEYANKLKEEIIKTSGIDTGKTLAVYYRGQDKSLETNVPKYEELELKVREIIMKNSFDSIFVQSDEREFIEYMKGKFDSVFSLEEIFKPNKQEEPTSIPLLIPDGSRKYQASIFLASIKIVSECRHVVLTSGNVGMWICMLRGNAQNVHQYLNPKDEIYGVKRELYARRDSFWIDTTNAVID